MGNQGLRHLIPLIPYYEAISKLIVFGNGVCVCVCARARVCVFFEFSLAVSKRDLTLSRELSGGPTPDCAGFCQPKKRS